MSNLPVKGPWPFEEGKVARLNWIGNPVTIDGKRQIPVYFTANKQKLIVNYEWGTLPLLALWAEYEDGDLNNPKITPKHCEEIVIPKTCKVEQVKWNPAGTNEELITDYLEFEYRQTEYRVSVIEVIRSMLAPNRTLLNCLLSPGMLDLMITATCDGTTLHLDFANEFNSKLLYDDFLFHLAWIYSNEGVERMVRSISRTYADSGSLIAAWDPGFPIRINGRIKYRNSKEWSGALILGINQVLDKEIKCSDIIFSHPKLGKKVSSDEPKKHRFVKGRKQGDSEHIYLDPEVDGSNGSDELIKINKTSDVYLWTPRISRGETKDRTVKTGEDSSTKTVVSKNNNARTTADVGGVNTAKALEFVPLDDTVTESDELNAFLEVLNRMKNANRGLIRDIQVSTGMLPISSGAASRFAFLSNRYARRHYAMALLTLSKSRFCMFVEVQREYRSISTLLMVSKDPDVLREAAKFLLVGLVITGGQWITESYKGVGYREIVYRKLIHHKNHVLELSAREEYYHRSITAMIDYTG